tara:strand:+ start:2025 stop:2837 length:813 start_codon:yes stop_codon:yes gene_type:complete
VLLSGQRANLWKIEKGFVVHMTDQNGFLEKFSTHEKRSLTKKNVRETNVSNAVLQQSYIETYTAYSVYFPKIIENWHPVNGHTQEVADARLQHFKTWFGIYKSPARAVSDIMAAEHPFTSDEFTYCDRYKLFLDYLWWVCALFADVPDSHFNTVPNTRHVRRNWNLIIDIAGENNISQKKNCVKVDLSVWLELSIRCLTKNIDQEYLMLLTYRMETATYHWELNYHKYLGGPFGYTEEKFERWAKSSLYERGGIRKLREQEEKFGIVWEN